MSRANAVRQSGFGSIPDKPVVDLATVRMTSTPAEVVIGPVETTVPAPSQYIPRQPGPITASVLELAAGQSRLISGATMTQVRSACGLVRKKIEGASYVIRAEENALRVWRRT
jgi:hypothetical protein